MGTKKPKPKRGNGLTPQQKAEIVRRLLSGETVTSIAREMKVSRMTIYGVRRLHQEGHLNQLVIDYLPQMADMPDALHELAPAAVPETVPLPPPPAQVIRPSTPDPATSLASDEDRQALSDKCAAKAQKILDSISDDEIAKAPLQHKVAAVKNLTDVAGKLVQDSTKNLGLLGYLLDEINGDSLSIRVGVDVDRKKPQNLALTEEPIDTTAQAVEDEDGE